MARLSRRKRVEPTFDGGFERDIRLTPEDRAGQQPAPEIRNQAKPAGKPGMYMWNMRLSMYGTWALKIIVTGPVRDIMVKKIDFKGQSGRRNHGAMKKMGSMKKMYSMKKMDPGQRK